MSVRSEIAKNFQRNAVEKKIIICLLRRKGEKVDFFQIIYTFFKYFHKIKKFCRNIIETAGIKEK